MQASTESTTRTPFRIPFWLGACGFAAIAVFFLWEEHSAHILGALPFVLLLLCPLMHFFMHRGHGDHGPRDNHEGHAGHRQSGSQP